MRSLIKLLVFVMMAPFALAAIGFYLLEGSTRVPAAQIRQTQYVQGNLDSGRDFLPPPPPGYPVNGQAPLPPAYYANASRLSWSKALLLAGLLAMGLVVVVAINAGVVMFLKSRGRPPQAGPELSSGVEGLLASLERMDARIGNLETILIERRR